MLFLFRRVCEVAVGAYDVSTIVSNDMKSMENSFISLFAAVAMSRKK